MPDWKQELMTTHFEDIDSLLEPTEKETIAVIRDLHFLGILSCCVEQGEGYGQCWDLVKECLRHELGNDVGDDLILGSYWEGSAWEFVPDLLSYQFGFLEGDRLKTCHQKVRQVTQERFVSTLQSIDLKENYPTFGRPIGEEGLKWTVAAFQQLNRNLERAAAKGLALFYTLD